MLQSVEAKHSKAQAKRIKTQAEPVVGMVPFRVLKDFDFDFGNPSHDFSTYIWCSVVVL